MNRAAPPKTSRVKADFLSSAKRFSLHPGSQVEADSVNGYYIDLRIKAASPRWPPDGFQDKLHVFTSQWGLGCYERYLAGDGDEWLQAAIAASEHLVRIQTRGGKQDGGWIHKKPYRHTFRVRPPWLSAMAQGQGASLLVRAHRATNEERFAEAATRALNPFAIPSSDGGVRAFLGGRPFPEEFPTEPPSFVLNGGIFAIWGNYDVWKGLGDEAAGAAFNENMVMLAANLHRWDTGYWSRYDLYPHAVMNVASSSYHVLHISQLRAMQLIAPRREFSEAVTRFEEYAVRRVNLARIFLRKSVFRVLVPRNRVVARVLGRRVDTG